MKDTIYGKSSRNGILIGKASINGGFVIARFDYGRVIFFEVHVSNIVIYFPYGPSPTSLVKHWKLLEPFIFGDPYRGYLKRSIDIHSQHWGKMSMDVGLTDILLNYQSEEWSLDGSSATMALGFMSCRF